MIAIVFAPLGATEVQRALHKAKGFCALALLLLSLAVAGDPQLLEQQEFASSYIQQLREKLPEAEIEVIDTLQLEVGLPGSEPMQVFLDNAWRSYVQYPDTLSSVLDSYTDSIVESMTSSPAPDIDRIVPVVKEPAWLEEVRSALAQQGTEMPEYLQVPLNDHLIVLYAEDTPTNIRYLQKDSLADLGVPLAELGSVALDNLRGLLPELQVMGGEGLYLVAAGGNYEASLLLYDRLWTHENFAVEGEIVVGVPTRDILVVTGTGDGDNLARVREIVRDAYGDGVYTLSPKLFVRRAGRWEVYE